MSNERSSRVRGLDGRTYQVTSLRNAALGGWDVRVMTLRFGVAPSSPYFRWLSDSNAAKPEMEVAQVHARLVHAIETLPSEQWIRGRPLIGNVQSQAMVGIDIGDERMDPIANPSTSDQTVARTPSSGTTAAFTADPVEPTAEDKVNTEGRRRSYAKWYVWARRDLRLDPPKSHAAAYTAIQALDIGEPVERATSLAKEAAAKRSVKELAEAADPDWRHYAGWTEWALGLKTDTDHETAFSAVDAMQAAIAAGTDSQAATLAAGVAVLGTSAFAYSALPRLSPAQAFRQAALLLDAGMFEAAEGCLRQLMSRPGRLGTFEYTTDTWGVALATPFESNQPIFDRVLELAAQSHTLDQQTADLFRNVGEHYRDGLDRRPAAACFRLAFQAQAKVLPLESGAIGGAADDVACAYTDLGFPYVAHEFLEKAFGLLGGFSQRADLVQTVLLSHPVNALNAFSERLPVLVETLGPAHVLVAATRYSIGIIAMGLRDFERAASEMEQSVAIRTGVDDAVLKAEAYYALGDAYEMLDRSADQIRAIRELISLLKVRRPTCALLVNAYFKLADLVTALGNPDEGEEARQAGIAVIASAPQLFAKLLDAMEAANEDGEDN